MRTRLNGSKMSPFLSLRGEAPSPVIARRLLRPTKQSQGSLGTGSAISNNEIPRSNRPRNNILGVFSNEKGIALVMVLILSAIALAIMSGLVYMVISGTQISGIQKRYKTALEAGIGGRDAMFEVIRTRGNTDIPTSICIETWSATCENDKLNKATSSWNAGCNSDLTMTTYDMTCTLGTSPNQYIAYSKIVDTVEGNSGGDEGLIKTGVVVSNPGEVAVKSIPYLYTIEIDAQNFSNPAERAKLSVLYQY